MHEHSAHRHNQLRTQDNIKIASAGLFCILQCYFHIYWVFFLLVVLNRHWPCNNYCDMNAQIAFFSNVKWSAANSPKKKNEVQRMITIHIVMPWTLIQHLFCLFCCFWYSAGSVADYVDFRASWFPPPLNAIMFENLNLMHFVSCVHFLEIFTLAWLNTSYFHIENLNLRHFVSCVHLLEILTLAWLNTSYFHIEGTFQD